MFRNKKSLYFIMIYLLIYILLNYFIPVFSSATTRGTVFLSTNKEKVEKGEEIEISINLEGNKTAAFNTNLYFDGTKVEYVSGPENINVIGNRILSIWYDKKGARSATDGEIVKYIFKAKEDGIANFTIDGDFYSSTGQSIDANFKSVQVQIGKQESKLEMQIEEQGKDSNKTNANLQSLRIDIEGLVPNFEPNIYKYYLLIPNNIQSVDILAVTENPNATVNISGNTNLKEGLNRIDVKIRSEDNTKEQIYTIEVSKTADSEAANANLETLTIENTLLNTPFDNNIINYTAQVPNSIENLNILAIPENENAKVQITGKDGLKVGNNTVYINVKAANGFTTKEFKIDVYKRNIEEEKKYQEEQSHLQEKLDEAYEIEKTSTNVEEQPNLSNEKENYTMIAILTIILIIIIISRVVYSKLKK